MVSVGVLISLPILGNIWVTGSTNGAVHRDLSDVEHTEVALVLGTTPFGKHGPNPFFEGRMDAAANLVNNGKVERLLLSGDNGTRYYNEPAEMRKALLKRGVPSSKIELDYAGFRTLDSVVRAKRVFGEKELLIVTDDFHAARALYIAKHYNMHAEAYVSSVALDQSMRVRTREIFSRCKALLDLHVLATKPKFDQPSALAK